MTCCSCSCNSNKDGEEDYTKNTIVGFGGVDGMYIICRVWSVCLREFF